MKYLEASTSFHPITGWHTTKRQEELWESRQRCRKARNERLRESKKQEYENTNGNFTDTEV